MSYDGHSIVPLESVRLVPCGNVGTATGGYESPKMAAQLLRSASGAA